MWLTIAHKRTHRRTLWHQNASTVFDFQVFFAVFYSETGVDRVCYCYSVQLVFMQLVPYYAPPLIGGDIKRCFCLTSVCLTFDVCLSRTSGLSREQRGLGRPKLAQRYPTSHVTRTPLSRSKVKVTRPLCSPPCWRVRRLQRWAWERMAVGNCCYVAVRSAAQSASAPTGEERGGGIPWRPPAFRLFTLLSTWLATAA